MKKTRRFFTALVLTACLLGISSSIVFASSENPSPLDELFPLNDDISHGFHNEEYNDEDLDEDDFDEGRSKSYTRLFDNHVIMSLHFKIYKFSSSEAADIFYVNKVEAIKSTVGYTEVNIPSAFAVIEYDDSELGNSWSVMNDMVFNVEIVNDWNSEETEEMLIYYTHLELDAIPEFPSWIILPIVFTATLAIAIYRKRMKRLRVKF